MRIKNTKRFILSLTVIFFIISFFASMITSKVFSHTEPNYESHVVTEGETLWEIASELDGNINENIYMIKETNKLSNSCIYVGQELLIPQSY